MELLKIYLKSLYHKKKKSVGDKLVCLYVYTYMYTPARAARPRTTLCFKQVYEVSATT